jgi:uncharacterized protein YjbI with pentapeptide repeats
MANPDHLERLSRGVQQWNEWRMQHPDVQPDLSGAGLKGISLPGIDLSEAKLVKAELAGARLEGANLNRAELEQAQLSDAYLPEAMLSEVRGHNCNLRHAWLLGARLQFADLNGSDLTDAILTQAWLWNTDLSNTTLIRARLDNTYLGAAKLDGADLTGAHLSSAQLLGNSLRQAKLVGCNVYSAAVWDVDLSGAVQADLVITHVYAQPRLTVDSLNLAQFVYLLLNNEEVRDAIDTLTTKVVLILGRFTEERKAVLDALRENLRQRDYVPIIFDFDKPASKDLTGTVETLARMARFIVADLTDPSSIPHELATVVPYLRSTPVQPLRLRGSAGYTLFDDLKVYPWVLEVYQYESGGSLISELDQALAPAEQKVLELRGM